MSGLQTIKSQVSYVSNVLFENARSPFGCSNVNARVRRSGGALSQLHKVFENVQKGKFTPDEAMVEVEKIFGQEAASLPDFIADLQDQFQNLPRNPEQLSLIDEYWEECNPLPSTTSKKKSTGSPRPKPVPPSQQYRVEIWRESKRDKKNVKVTKLKGK